MTGQQERISRPARYSAEMVWSVQKFFRTQVLFPENLTLAESCLKDHSLLVFFNHISALDPGLVLKTLTEKIKNPARVMIFTSKKHLDPERGTVIKLQTTVEQAVSTIKGFEILEVVQEGDRENYPQFAKINLPSILRAIRAVRQPGTLLLIAPEETRSKDGNLLQAKEGMRVLFELEGARGNLLALPIGITGTNRILPPGSFLPNPFAASATLSIGRPLSYFEIQADSTKWHLSIQDTLMVHLARFLPENQRGYYRSYSLNQT